MATVHIYDMADTWNDGGTTFAAIKMNVTDTASAAASLLMDLQVGGASKFNVGKAGDTTLASAAFLAWSTDLKLWRDAANTLAQRNGTVAQVFRVYNTFTDASNYELARVGWDTNVLYFGREWAGTGIARSIRIGDASNYFQIDTSGNAFSSLRIGVTPNFLLAAPSAGVATLLNFDANDFNRLQFGGTTSAFPALKRSSAVLQARLADDSAYGAFDALEFRASGTKVIGAQGAAVADATDAASAITQLNALLARVRAHGLIAT